jgi:hypothetical protein
MGDNVSPDLLRKFDAAAALHRQMHRALRDLEETYGYAVKLQAELAACPLGTYYKYVPKEYEKSEPIPGPYWEALKLRLAQDYGNYYLYTAFLPEGVQIALRGGAAQPNGLEDEHEAVSIATGKIAIAKRSGGDPDLIDETASELEALVPALRAEAAAERARRSQRPVRVAAQPAVGAAPAGGGAETAALPRRVGV